jgi:hypothetical protein
MNKEILFSIDILMNFRKMLLKNGGWKTVRNIRKNLLKRMVINMMLFIMLMKNGVTKII